MEVSLLSKGAGSLNMPLRMHSVWGRSTWAILGIRRRGGGRSFVETWTGHNEGGVFLLRRVGWVPVAPALESFGD